MVSADLLTIGKQKKRLPLKWKSRRVKVNGLGGAAQTTVVCQGSLFSTGRLIPPRRHNKLLIVRRRVHYIKVNYVNMSRVPTGTPLYKEAEFTERSCEQGDYRTRESGLFGRDSPEREQQQKICFLFGLIKQDQKLAPTLWRQSK